MGEMDKSRELYSREGGNSSRFEEKTVAWEHTINFNLCSLHFEVYNPHFEVYYLHFKVRKWKNKKA